MLKKDGNELNDMRLVFAALPFLYSKLSIAPLCFEEVIPSPPIGFKTYPHLPPRSFRVKGQLNDKKLIITILIALRFIRETILI